MSLPKRMTQEQLISIVKSLFDVERTCLNLGREEMEEMGIAWQKLYIEWFEKEIERLGVITSNK